MKKYIICLLITVGLTLFFYDDKDIALVFNEQSTEYSMYILEFPNLNISTSNLENYFKNIQIIWVEPYINVLYKEKINYKQYYFENISVKENIDRFKNSLSTRLQNNNYKLDAINLRISGIKISKMKVYSNEQDILNLKIDGLKYKKVE